MSFEELLRAQGLTEEQIAAITAAMTENKIYITGLENAQTRYDKLTQQKDAVDAELATATQTIADLKAQAEGNADLQAKITEYESQISSLKAEAATAAKTYAVTDALKAAGVIDADYLIYKHGGIDKFVFDAENKPIGIDDILKSYKEDEKYSHLFKPEQKPGGYNPNGGTGGNVKNPFAKDTLNYTEQGRLLRENPEQARALAAAAGVTI